MKLKLSAAPLIKNQQHDCATLHFILDFMSSILIINRSLAPFQLTIYWNKVYES